MTRLDEQKQALHGPDAARVRQAISESEGDEQAFAQVLDAFAYFARSPRRRVFFETFAERPDARYEPPLWEALLQPLQHNSESLDRAAALHALARRRGLPGLRPMDLTEVSVTLFTSARCVRTLGSLGDRRVVTLLRALFDAEDEEFSDKARLALVQTLAQLGGDEAIALLMDLLDDGSWEVREAAQQALVTLGPAVADRLLGFVESASDERAQRAAAAVLVRLGDPRVLPLLVARVRHWEPFALEQLLSLGEIGVRAMAAPPYLDLELMREVAVELARHGERFRPLLMDLLGSANLEGRPLAVLGLVQLGGPGVGALLRGVLADRQAGQPARLAAGMELGTLQDHASLPTLRAALADDDPQMQLCVMSVLERMDDEDAIPALSELLTSPHEAVRLGALDALGSLEAVDAQARITPLLEDPLPQVRTRAQSILKALAEATPG